MNCDHIIELLPWLLNGTLGEDERRTVREHLASCSGCRAALADTRRAWEIFDQHIPAAALVALAAGEPAAGFDPAVLAEHLATCPECAAELELVRTSRALTEDDSVAVLARLVRTAQPAGPAGGNTTVPLRRPAGAWRAAALAACLAGVVTASGWYNSAEHARSLDERLAAAAVHPGSPSGPSSPPAPQPTPSSPFSRPDANLGGAADKTGALTRMQAQIETLKKTVDQLETSNNQAREQLAQIGSTAARPQVNTWVAELRESRDVMRGGAGEPDQVLPASAAATLQMRAGENAQGERDLDVVDAAGKVVLQATGLRADDDNHYNLTLLRGALKPGDYTFRLFRREGGRRAPAESYTVRVQ